MPRPDPFLDKVKANLAGQPADMTTATSSPPYNPVSRDKMTAGISAKLKGEQAPSDTADVPEGVDPDVWADANRAARDPQDPAHRIADALLTVAAALADLKSQDGAQPL
jgi:hypothetical protein